MTSSRNAGRIIVVSLVAAGVPAWLVACASTTDGTGTGGAATSGGSSGTAGSVTGGASGQATGGQSAGGTSGTSTGGVGTGGLSTGGVSTGGTAPGGSSSGGSSAGDTGGAGGIAGGTAGSGGTGGASGGNAGASGAAGAATGGSGGGSGGACSSSMTLKSGDTTIMLTVGGVERSFIVHAPPSYDGMTRMPVVFDFHGLGGTASMWRRGSRWASYGDSQGFITVYPQGLPDMTGGSPGWNAGGCCVTVADDVAFVRAMITHIEGIACVDSKRIHATGCSNGGAMSFMLACNAADVIASVAPVDFDCVVGGRCMQCNPGRPVTEIQFRGTSDTAVPYGDTETSGARANFTRWGQINMCTGMPAPLSTNAACQTYPMCGSGQETILCTVQNGSHCGSYQSFMIPEVAWDVLKRHPLP